MKGGNRFSSNVRRTSIVRYSVKTNQELNSLSYSIIRLIYQKFREVDILDKKKTVTALKPGEDRAILLGLGMILSSVMMYFVLGVTILRSYADRYSPAVSPLRS